MQKHILKTFFILALFLGAQSVFAAVPTLSFGSYGTDGSNSAQINVYADANAPVYLYVTNTNGSYGAQSGGTVGTTNASGHLSFTVYGSTYGLNSNSSLYVIVNGLQSSAIFWQGTSYNNGNYYNGNSYSNVTASQTSVTLSAGQNSNVSLYGSQSGSYYVASNTGTVGSVNATVSGNTLALTGNYAGSASIVVCSNYNLNYNGNYNQNCANVYVSVVGYSNGNYNNGYTYYNYNYGYNYNNPITLAQNSLNLNIGEQRVVCIFGNTYNANFTVSNSNYSAVSVTTSGSNLYVSAMSPGTSYITVCQTGGYSQCANLTVTVYGNNYSYYPQYPYYNQPVYYYPPQMYQSHQWYGGYGWR